MTGRTKAPQAAAAQLGSNISADAEADAEAAAAADADIPPEDPPVEPIQASTAPAVKKVEAKGMPGRIWVILEENDDIPPTGLFVSHNGAPFLIRTGEPVAVPDFILGILDDAIQAMPVVDPQSRRVIGHRDRMRYPYRRVAAPMEPE